jgi:hypothetical protein
VTAPTDSKGARPVLVAALAQAEATVTTLRAALDASEPAPPSNGDELLDLKALKSEFDLRRDAALAAHQRGELELVRGSRRRLMARRSSVENYMRSQPPRARQRAKPAEAANDAADWEAQQVEALARRAR